MKVTESGMRIIVGSAGLIRKDSVRPTGDSGAPRTQILKTRDFAVCYLQIPKSQTHVIFISAEKSSFSTTKTPHRNKNKAREQFPSVHVFRASPEKLLLRHTDDATRPGADRGARF